MRAFSVSSPLPSRLPSGKWKEYCLRAELTGGEVCGLGLGLGLGLVLGTGAAWMGVMAASGQLLNVLFGLVSVLTGGLFLVGGVLAFRAVRNGGSILLMVGAALALLCSVFWLVFNVTQMSGVMNFDSEFVRIGLPIVRFASTLGWLMMAVGVVMLSFVLGSLRRQTKALESIVAGSKTDRIA